jgi:hypothetical protein
VRPPALPNPSTQPAGKPGLAVPLVWLVAALLLASPAAAQQPAGAEAQTPGRPTPPSAPPKPAQPDPCASPPPADASAQQAQRHFEQLEPHCLRSAAYYRQRGQWLLKQGNPGAAIEALERALLLEPAHLGTQLDYAQALIAIGDLASATGLLLALQAQPNVPPPIATLIAGQLQALNQLAAASLAPAQGLSSRFMLSQAVGHDSNLNNASSATNITLTYPEADLNLPLQEASRPLPGAAVATALQWTGLLPVDNQLWLFQAKAQARHTQSPANRYQQAELGATWLQNPGAPRQWIARAEHTQLRWADRNLYNSAKLSLQHQWAHSLPALSQPARPNGASAPGPFNCRSAFGAELEDRTFPGSPSANGLYRGAIFTLACQNTHSLSLQLRTGLDQPHQANRVGGAQRQHEARAQWQFSANGTDWQAEYSHQRQQDTTGYSPLLARNAVRRVTRQTLRLEASQPTQWASLGNPQWFGSLELTRQSSNLPLFSSSRHAAQTGLRWLWP